MRRSKDFSRKRNSLAYLIGLATLNYIDKGLRKGDTEDVKTEYKKTIDMLTKEYGSLLEKAKNEVGVESQKN